MRPVPPQRPNPRLSDAGPEEPRWVEKLCGVFLIAALIVLTLASVLGIAGRTCGFGVTR